MARPRIVKLPNGVEISIKGADAEEGSRLKALLLGESSASAPAPSAPRAAPAPTGEMSCVALGMFEENKNWSAAVVVFNPSTKEASVKEVKNCGRLKGSATLEFKKLAVKYNFV